MNAVEETVWSEQRRIRWRRGSRIPGDGLNIVSRCNNSEQYHRQHVRQLSQLDTRTVVQLYLLRSPTRSTCPITNTPRLTHGIFTMPMDSGSLPSQPGIPSVSPITTAKAVVQLQAKSLPLQQAGMVPHWQASPNGNNQRVPRHHAVNPMQL